MCRILLVEWQIQAKSYRYAVRLGMGEQGDERLGMVGSFLLTALWWCYTNQDTESWALEGLNFVLWVLWCAQGFVRESSQATRGLKLILV